MLQNDPFWIKVKRCFFFLVYRGGHGIHSPLGFWLSTRVLQDRRACFYGEEELLNWAQQTPQKNYFISQIKLFQLAFRLYHSLSIDRLYYIGKDLSSLLLLQHFLPTIKPITASSEWVREKESSEITDKSTRHYSSLLVIDLDNHSASDLDTIFSALTASKKNPSIILIMENKRTKREAHRLYKKITLQEGWGMGFDLGVGFLFLGHPKLQTTTYKQWLR